MSASSTPPAQADRGDSRLWLRSPAFLFALGVWLFIHLVFCAVFQLVPDEAYYWVWSRHLALSYVDHPPMVAYLIRLGNVLLGQTEFGVRCIMALLVAATLFIVARTARRLVPGDNRAAAFVAIALLCSPIFSVIGSIATPDTPAMFFQAAALATVLSIFIPSPISPLGSPPANSPFPFDSLNRRRTWLAFGLLLGLALLSKYTAALLGIAVLLALLSSAEGRWHLRTPWPWLGAAFSAAIFSPVVLWNSRHNWISFGFQLGHVGLDREDTFTLRYLGDFVGGQAAAYTPVLFGLCVIALAAYWSRRGLPMHMRILLLSATVPLAVVGISALRRRAEINWPVFAFIPAMLLVGCWASERWTQRFANLARLAIVVALFCTVIVRLPKAFWTVAPQFNVDRWDDTFGWRELAREVAPRVAGLPVITSKYQYSSELSFYLPGHPVVLLVPDPEDPKEFQFLPGYQLPERPDQLLVVVDLAKTGRFLNSVGLPAGFDPIEAFPVEVDSGKHIVRRSLIVVAGAENASPPLLDPGEHSAP